MATSKTGYSSKKGNSGHVYRLKLNMTCTSQNPAANTSTVRIRAWIQSFNNSSFNMTSSYEGRFSGTELVNTSKRVACSGNGEVLLFDYSRTVSHNSSGDRTVAASAEFSNSLTGTHSIWIDLKLDNLASPPDAPPTAPVATRSGDRITVTSATADGNGNAITGYQIRRRNDGNGPWSGWTTTSGKTLTFKSAHLGHYYQFESRAENAGGWGPWSPTRTFFMPDDTTGVGTVTIELAPGTVKGVWQEPEVTENLTGYNAYLHDGTSWGSAVPLDPEDLTYEWDSLPTGTYMVGVETVYTTHTTTRSDSDPTYLGTLPDPISAVTLSAEGEADWTAPGDGGTPILAYEVEWWDGIEWVAGEPTTGLSASYQPAAMPGIGYRARIRPVNAVGPAAWEESDYVCLVDCGCTV